MPTPSRKGKATRKRSGRRSEADKPSGGERGETAAAIARRGQQGGVSRAELRVLARDRRATVRALAARLQRRFDAASAEQDRLDGMLSYERALWDAGVRHVAGVDEAGAGPLAGPVMAAAVVLPAGVSIPGIDDSKRLTAAEREQLAAVITSTAVAYAHGACSVEEIDELNILQASREAMRRAVAALRVEPEHVLVDARRVPGECVPQTSIINGDGLSQSIAAASVLAKVARDALMVAAGQQYPGYGFEQHKGYGTAGHLAALQVLGPCPLHRRSFGPVARLLGPEAMRQRLRRKRRRDDRTLELPL